jgi:hypothetical protein
MKDLEMMENELCKLIDDFNKQVGSMDDYNDFHNRLIKLSTEHPQHKELLEFIVMINDKLETKHSIFSDLITDSFVELMGIKKQVIKKMIEKEEKKTLWNRLTSVSLKDYKFILLIIAIIVIGTGLIIYPKAALVLISKI